MADNSTILFRVDSSSIIGLGHLSRCLTLANQLREYNISSLFVCQNYIDSALDLILESGHRIIEMTPRFSPRSESYSSWLGQSEKEDSSFILDLIRENNEIIGVVLDHYGATLDWHSRIHKERPLAIIDDLANRKYSCSILIDQTFQRSEREYQELVDRETKLLLGTKYCLLRPEFTQSNCKESESAGNRILVMAGGTDPHNLSTKVVRSLIPLDNRVHITILTGSKNQNLEELKEMSLGQSNCDLQIDSTNVANLMKTSDVCIGSIGTSTWERFAIGLPSICITTAENQETIAERLSNSGLIEYLGRHDKVSEESIVTTVNNFINNKKNKHTHSSLRNLCDGKGAKRVVESILEEFDHGI